MKLLKTILISTVLTGVLFTSVFAKDFDKGEQPLDKSFTIKLNKDLDSSTINGNNIYAVDTTNPNMMMDIPITLVNKNTIIINVDKSFKWEKGKNYDIVLTKGIKDTSGKSLKEETRIRFNISATASDKPSTGGIGSIDIGGGTNSGSTTNIEANYTLANGLKGNYSGAKTSDVANGQGTFKRIDNGLLLWTYVGNFTNGNMDGTGKITYSDGKTYEGDFVTNQITGNGKLTTSLYAYTGEFLNGKMNGTGTIIFTNGQKYEGDFANNTYNGQGTLTFSDGKKITGTFTNGMYKN